MTKEMKKAIKIMSVSMASLLAVAAVVVMLPFKATAAPTVFCNNTSVTGSSQTMLYNYKSGSTEYVYNTGKADAYDASVSGNTFKLDVRDMVDYRELHRIDTKECDQIAVDTDNNSIKSGNTYYIRSMSGHTKFYLDTYSEKQYYLALNNGQVVINNKAGAYKWKVVIDDNDCSFSLLTEDNKALTYKSDETLYLSAYDSGNSNQKFAFYKGDNGTVTDSSGAARGIPCYFTKGDHSPGVTNGRDSFILRNENGGAASSIDDVRYNDPDCIRFRNWSNDLGYSNWWFFEIGDDNVLSANTTALTGTWTVADDASAKVASITEDGTVTILRNGTATFKFTDSKGTVYTVTYTFTAPNIEYFPVTMYDYDAKEYNTYALLRMYDSDGKLINNTMDNVARAGGTGKTYDAGTHISEAKVEPIVFYENWLNDWLIPYDTEKIKGTRWTNSINVGDDITQTYANNYLNRYTDNIYGKNLLGDKDKAYNDAVANHGNTGGRYYPFPGIAKDELDSNHNIQFNYPEGDIFVNDVDNDGKVVYQNISMPFLDMGDGYYILDSSKYHTYFNDNEYDDNKTLDVNFEDRNVGGTVVYKGFFPYSSPYLRTGTDDHKDPYVDNNFGMVMEKTFYLTSNGKNVNGDDIIFEFSGDDDIWVFVDDKLALDIGGIHQPIHGKIDFTNKKSTVYVGLTDVVYNETDLSEQLGVGGYKTDVEHTLKIFYLERGSGDSNCKISFNFPLEKTLGITAQKTWDNGGLSVDHEPVGVSLYRKLGENDPEKVGDTQYLSAENGWKYTWDGLYHSEKDGDKTVFYTYYIAEDAIPGYTATFTNNSVTADASTPNGAAYSIGVTNTVQRYGVTVKYQDTEGNTLLPDAVAYENTPYGSTYNVSDPNRVNYFRDMILADEVIEKNRTGYSYYFTAKAEDPESGTLDDDKVVIYKYVPFCAPVIEKAVDKSLIEITDESGEYSVCYTLTVQNSNAYDLTNVNVVDPLPTGLAFVKAYEGGNISKDGRSVVWNGLTVPANSEKQVKFEAKLADSDPANSARLGCNATYTNIANITSFAIDPDNDGTFTNIIKDISSNPVTTDVYRTPTIEKAVYKTKAAVDEAVPYTLTVKNNSSVALYNVKVSDELPAGMVFDSGTDGTCTDGVFTAVIDSIPFRGEATVTFTAKITDPTKLTYTNQAYITEAYLGIPDPEDPSDPPESIVPPETPVPSNEVVTKIDSNPAIEKTVDKAAARRGDTLTYTITVTNSTADKLYNVLVSDTLPEGLTYVSTSGAAVNSDCTEWTIASIEAGQSAAYTVTARVDADCANIVTNTATLVKGYTDDDGDGTPEQEHEYDKDSSVPTKIISDPTISKSRDRAVGKQGDIIEYTLTVRNPDTQFDMYDVAVSDELPEGLTFKNASDGGVYDEATRVITWNIAKIDKTVDAANVSAKTLIFTAEITDRSKAIYYNTAYILSASADTNGDGTAYSTKEYTDNHSETVDTDVLYDLTVDYKAIDADEKVLDVFLKATQSITNQPNGGKYNIDNSTYIPEYIVASDGSVWVKKNIKGSPLEGEFDSDKAIVVEYVKHPAKFNVTKWVSDDDGATWQKEVTVYPGTEVLFKTIVENTDDYPVNNLDLSEEYTLNGNDTAMPDDWNNIIKAFDDETEGSLTAHGKWESSPMPYTVPNTAVDTDVYCGTAAVQRTENDKVSDNALVKIRTVGAIDIVKTAVIDADENGAKKTYPGERVSFSLVVTNTGHNVLSNVQVIDNDYDVILSDGVTVVTKGQPIDTIAQMQPGETKQYVVYFDVPANAENGAEFLNTATAKGTDPYDNPVEDTDDDTVIITPRPAPQLSIIKKVVNAEGVEGGTVTAKPGERVTYTVTVRNTGNAPAANVYVNDYMLDGDRRVAESSTWAIAKGWVIDEIPAGGSYTVEDEVFVWNVPLNTPEDTLFTNVAELYNSRQDCIDGKDPVDKDEAKVRTAGDYSLTVLKTADLAVAKPGDKITYTIVVTNSSNAVLTDIRTIDSLAGEWDKLPGKTQAEKNVSISKNSDNTLNIDKLEAGDSITLNFFYTVPGDFTGDEVKNNVKAESETPDGTVSDDDDAVTRVIHPDLEVTKTAAVSEVAPGGTVTYTVTVTNTGKYALSDVVVVDNKNVTVTGESFTKADGTTGTAEAYAGGVNENEYAPNTVIGYYPTLEAGENRIISVSYTVPATAEKDDVITNTATATDADGRTGTDSADVTVVVNEQPPKDYKLNIVKAANVERADVGDTVSYNIMVTNTGKDTLHNVAITDILAVEYNGKKIAAGNPIETLAKLEPNETKSVVVTYTVPKDVGDTLTNTAYADSDETDKVSSEVPVQIRKPAMKITKTVSTQRATPGQKVYYTLVITNTGNCNLTELEVEDALIGYKTTIPSLKPGEKWSTPEGTLYYTFGTDAKVGSTFNNNATVMCAEVLGASDSASELGGKTRSKASVGTTVVIAGDPYTPVPETGDSSSSNGHYAAVACIFLVSIISCITAGYFVFAKGRKKNHED